MRAAPTTLIFFWPVSALMKIEPYEAKTVVREQKNSRAVHLNPYQGCYHDCVYCDGKSEGYHMHEDFGSRIRVKINAPELLEKYLQKRGFLPVNREKTGTLVDYMPDKKEMLARSQDEKFTIGISGGVCDIYQPAEEEVKMSRKMLQVVYDYGFPVFLLTKNKLVLRDLDLLRKINENAEANVAMTVTLADDKLREIFEPRASSTPERFEALRKLHEGGIHTGIWFMPILPWIGDTDENLDAVFRLAKENNVEWMVWAGMTLKPGRQKMEFMGVIEKHFPDLLPKYQKLYGNDHKYGHPDIAAAREMGLEDSWKKAKAYADKYGTVTKGWYGDGEW